MSVSYPAVATYPSGAFSPSELPGLAAWYKADAGVTKDGSNVVSAWADQSGNARTLTSGGAPLWRASQLNGLPDILFDGVDDALATSAFTLNQPVTHYLLFKQVSWTDQDRIIDGAAALNTGMVRQAGASPGIATYSGSVGPSTTDLAVGTYGILTVQFNGASSLIQVNNVAAATGDVGADNPGGLTLATRQDFFSSYANIAVVEWIVRSTFDDASTRTLHKNYLAGRGGLSL